MTKAPASPFQESVAEMDARHARWRSGEIRPLNRRGLEAPPEEIEQVIAEQRAAIEQDSK
jgi:hypothetical protein